ETTETIDLPNCVYKKEGNVIANPITYVQGQEEKPNSFKRRPPEASHGIYLSHLDEILLSKNAPLFSTFFIFVHKGCGMNCVYCGGCREAQEKTFNRSKLYQREPAAVRSDINEAKPYTSTFMFDFDMPEKALLEYLKKIWQGIDLSDHFCIFLNLETPSAEVIEYVNKTFKYVYWNLDIAGLSGRQREQLSKRGMVKPQPSDQQIINFFDQCEQYPNNEVRINMIAGLPYFTPADITQGEELLGKLTSGYNCVSELHWARLHAQPGAPIAENAADYEMTSGAANFEEFQAFSQRNFNEKTTYPGVENFDYPYIYFKDERLNSQVSKFYAETNQKISQYIENRRKYPLIGEKITYRELNRRANRLAAQLRDKGVQTDTIVGLMVNPSLETAVGILGIMKAGGAYLPIDPAHPAQRKEYMLKDSAAKICVTQKELLKENKELLTGTTLEEIIVTGEEEETNGTGTTIEIEPGNEREIDMETGNNPDQLAYVIYTSGTTGKPKGTL
ncbi:MAG: AMP-binding protein, partial [bacterium]|nr:AMP-binding protein [bacterium]